MFQNLFRIIGITKAIILSSFIVHSQVPQSITLQKTIKSAQQSSLAYKIAINLAKTSHWDYLVFRAGLRPKLAISGELPDYYRSISKITLPSGQNEFVPENFINSYATLSLQQKVSATGGTIGLFSSLQRIQNLGQTSSRAFTSVPISLTYTQSNIFFNELRFSKTLEQIKIKESERRYVEDLENIAFEAVGKYFNVLTAETQMLLDTQNQQSLDTLLKSTLARNEIGTSDLNDVLQAKMSHLNAKNAVNISQLRLATAKQEFIRLLNMARESKIIVSVPEIPIIGKLETDVAIRYARMNRRYQVEFERRKLEAEIARKRIQAATTPSVFVRANLGVTQTGRTVADSYTDLFRNQYFTVGFNIPILDWGVNKASRKKAEAMVDLEKSIIEQETLSYEQEVESEVMKWNLLVERMKNLTEVEKLAEHRYGIAKQKYLLGTLNFTDFNIAQQEKDRAVTDSINGLRESWLSYYKLRRMTLYDFVYDRPIAIEELILD
ncbi:TolC family protein [Pedobacter sp. SYP-B3415]|uniref:TolC family protein n=1 Tax=Pedobacter sp. SYP-B3415 TaxID=2496641 RepID=UPI00101BE2DB|nr:TolC family protein [Pedobacter sp. SYP-B3415]